MDEKTLREKIRSQGKESSTADAYWHWWQRYVNYLRANKIGKETQAERAVERFLSTLDTFQHDGYNDTVLDWRLAVKVLIWVIMRGSYAAPILDRYANPHVLPAWIGVRDCTFVKDSKYGKHS